VRLNVDCVRCGGEAEIYRADLCWRCHLCDLVDDVLAGPDDSIPEQLRPVRAALLSMERPNSGVTWIRQAHVDAILRQLATGQLALTHDAFDSLPRSRTTSYIRDLLVEHGTLPHRDRLLHAYATWLTARLAEISDPDHRSIVKQFGTWHHLRRLRAKAERKPLTPSAFLNAKQSTSG